jgi:hypothetical protein
MPFGNVVPLAALLRENAIAVITPGILERDIWIRRFIRLMEAGGICVRQMLTDKGGFPNAMCRAFHEAVLVQLLGHVTCRHPALGTLGTRLAPWFLAAVDQISQPADASEDRGLGMKPNGTLA